jgi:hypothetical protein
MSKRQAKVTRKGVACPAPNDVLPPLQCPELQKRLVHLRARPDVYRCTMSKLSDGGHHEEGAAVYRCTMSKQSDGGHQKEKGHVYRYIIDRQSDVEHHGGDAKVCRCSMSRQSRHQPDLGKGGRVCR